MTLITLYGHRGAKGEAPENTVTGFLYAKAKGIRAFELDVRLSADDKLAVLHDATVDRTTNGSGAVSDLTSSELAALDARSDFADWPEPAGVPILDDILNLDDGELYLIEIKSDAPVRLTRVCELLRATLERYPVRERTVVTSFDPVALEIMGQLDPSQPRGYIGGHGGSDYLAQVMRLGCSQAHFSLQTGSAEDVLAAKEAALRVVGRPGNTVQDLDQLVSWGSDAITSDYPSAALAYFSRRGIPVEPAGRSEGSV